VRVSWLSLKIKVYDLSVIWPQNWWLQVSQFRPQNRQLQFGDLGHKITVSVFWFEPQNQTDFGLSVALQNRWMEDSAGHASRFGGLLRLKASHARVFQTGLKTDGGATAGGARGTIVEVVLSPS
jgi:hypothetical protein